MRKQSCTASGTCRPYRFCSDEGKGRDENSNTLEWELKQVYPKEYEIGLQAVELMQKRTHLNIPQDEAAFITLHFVNF